jgi:hypothetical protein
VEPEDRGIPVADNVGADHVVAEITGAILVVNDHEHRQGLSPLAAVPVALIRELLCT